MSKTRQLKQLLAERSVKRGQFTLASGKASTVYVDARITTMSPDGMVLIGALALEAKNSRGWDPDAVGGLTLGADPVAYAISQISAGTTRSVRAFTVRKQAKVHGTAKLIEGPFKSGDRVVVVEDVITTGSSALQAAEAVTAEGGHILGILAVVDREDGGSEAIRAKGYDVLSLTRISELTSLSSESGSGDV